MSEKKTGKTLTECFAEEIKKGLNDYAQKMDIDRYFVIYTNGGEAEDVTFSPYEAREPSERAQTVYGVFDADPSRLAPMQGVTVVTYTGTLDIMVEAKLGRTTQIGEFEEVTVIEQLLNGFGQLANGSVYDYEDNEGKRFTVTANFSPAFCGDWQVHSTVFGEVIPVSMSVYLTAVENGVSASDLKLWIDGQPIYYENLVLTRQKTPDQYTYKKGESVKSTIVQHAFGVDFTMPLLRNSISAVIAKEIVDGSYNTPHIVTVEMPGNIENDYLCIFGNGSLTSQPGKNVGATVSLIEVKEGVAFDNFKPDDRLYKENNQLQGNTGEWFTTNDLILGAPDKNRYSFFAISTDGSTIKYGSFEYDYQGKVIVKTNGIEESHIWVSNYGES